MDAAPHPKITNSKLLTDFNMLKTVCTMMGPKQNRSIRTFYM